MLWGEIAIFSSGISFNYSAYIERCRNFATKGLSYYTFNSNQGMKNSDMKDENRLYLDHAATTPIIDVALEAIARELQIWTNPSSPHKDGRSSKARLEQYRHAIKQALNWDGHILFTSGASEAIAMVMRAYPHDIFVSAGEHEAVLVSSGAKEGKSRILALDKNGYVNDKAMVEAITVKERPLCAIQSVNNETGIIQPLNELREVIHAKGGLLFCDCSQSVGKMGLPEADIIALSGHKLGAPPGIGALLIKDLSMLNPTGGQEHGYRRGTENIPYIAAMAAVLGRGYDWIDKAQQLRIYLDDQIKISGGEVIGDNSERLAVIGSYRMPGVSASAQLIEFDMKAISVSAGSACSSGTLKTSHVLTAMGYDGKEATEVIRVSFGPDTQKEDIDRFIACWQNLYERQSQ